MFAVFLLELTINPSDGILAGNQYLFMDFHYVKKATFYSL